PVVDRAVAPREGGVSVREIREVAAADRFAPRVRSPVAAARRVFPFRLGGQPIAFALARAEPLAELNRLEAAHIYHRMPLVGFHQALAGMGWIEKLVLLVGDWLPRDEKSRNRHLAGGLLVRGRA